MVLLTVSWCVLEGTTFGLVVEGCHLDAHHPGGDGVEVGRVDAFAGWVHAHKVPAAVRVRLKVKEGVVE